jgi:3-hydroxybutyryl-CoA dehydrogenase
MTAPQTDTVVVIGAGTMGLGIAQNLLQAGATVYLTDTYATTAEAARDRIADGLHRKYKAETDPSARANQDLSRLHVSIGPAVDANPALVIEAVPEIPALKATVLAEAEASYPDASVLASNTSSLSINGLANGLARPDRFIGMHFFNPVPQSVLVELVFGDETSSVALATTRTWAARLGKEAIEVHDSPGFATSRLGLALGLEAIRMVEAGVASAEHIDKGMVLGYKHATGPLRLTDIVGLDVRLGIAEHLSRELGPRFEPPQLLRDMVAAGKLGKKSGGGFYLWAT